MKLNIVFLGVACLTASAASAAGFFTCTQNVEVVFGSAAEAAAASARAAILPPGKTCAFSSRWDDSGPREAKLPMAQTLTALGVKPTFYLCSDEVTSNYVATVARPVLATGSTIGSHTLTHPMLQEFVPNASFREIMKSRIDLETRCQAPVVAFVLPYCDYSTRADPDCAVRIGQSLVRAGYLGGPEFWPDVAGFYHLDPKDWCGSMMFSVNDRAPERKTFLEKFDMGLRESAAGRLACGPHFTLGIHTWQGPAGIKLLGTYVSERAHRPDVWYCSENEWIAARIQALHSTVEKVGVKGATATFRIVRPMPFELGADVPLTLDFSAGHAPLAVTNAAGLAVPSRFAPGGILSAAAFAADGSVAGSIPVDAPAGTYYLTFRPGVTFTGGVQRRAVKPGESFSFNPGGAVLKDGRPDPACQGGKPMVALSCDYRAADGAWARDWRLFERTPTPVAPVPDGLVVRVAGPIPEADASARFAAFSKPGDLAPLTNGVLGVWRPAGTIPDGARYVFAGDAKDRDWQSAAAALAKQGAVRVVYVVDFKVDAAGLFSLLGDTKYGHRYALDGQPVADIAKPVRLAAGPHRVAAAVGYYSWRPPTFCFGVAPIR